MRPKTILKVSASVALCYGLAFLLAPNVLMVTVYHSPAMNHPGVYNTSLLGGALIAIAFLNWRTAMISEAASIRLVLMFNLVHCATGMMITLIQQMLSNAAVPMGWVNVAIYLVLALAFASAVRFSSTHSREATARGATRSHVE